MASVVYLRILDNDKVFVSLLAAKTKVAPVKTLTTPSKTDSFASGFRLKSVKSCRGGRNV